MNIKSKIKLILLHPLSFIIFVLHNFISRRRLKFKRKMLQMKYSIPNSVGFHLNTYIYGNGKIQLGENTYFGKNTFVVSNPAENQIVIGKNCRISHGCHFRTEDNDPSTLHLNKPIKLSNDIIIGDNCWIGANVFIKGGVKIGNNTTIGANSVVTKSFPENAIIAGVPARLIKILDEPK